jgi:hypothetical protein
MQTKLAGSMSAPLLGLTALGIPLAGYVGMRYGEGSAAEEARKKALTSFGAGLATGVAAPRLVGKLQDVLQEVQTGMPVGGMPTGEMPMYGYPKLGSVEDGVHLRSFLQKEAMMPMSFADEAAGMAGSLFRGADDAIGAGARAAKDVAGEAIGEGAEAATKVKPRGPQTLGKGRRRGSAHTRK